MLGSVPGALVMGGVGLGNSMGGSMVHKVEIYTTVNRSTPASLEATKRQHVAWAGGLWGPRPNVSY